MPALSYIRIWSKSWADEEIENKLILKNLWFITKLWPFLLPFANFFIREQEKQFFTCNSGNSLAKIIVFTSNFRKLQTSNQDWFLAIFIPSRFVLDELLNYCPISTYNAQFDHNIFILLKISHFAAGRCVYFFGTLTPFVGHTDLFPAI
jgi:hypothetical protein